jgi:Putative MetA-pathway of phenol degradation
MRGFLRHAPFAFAGLALFAAPAMARDTCPERPGQTTPPCTVEPGHALAEMGLIDWSLQNDIDVRSDTITIGQVALRVGIADHAEIAIGWTPFTTARTRNRTTGGVDRESGVGDVGFAIKRSFGRADSPIAAIKAFVTVPVGKGPAGAGDWSAGLQLPMALPLSDKWQFALTPEIDAAVDDDGSGRHLAYGGAAGIGYQMSKRLSLSADVRVLQDNAPGDPSTHATAGMALAYQPSDMLQFDIGATIGLNRTSPDLETYIGISKRF